MAKNLTMTNIFSSNSEPKRQNRWIMSITGPPRTGEIDGAEDELGFAAHTANRPEITFDQQEMHRLNERFYIAGKPTWNELNMEFYDFINGQKSASYILWSWATLVYNPVLGVMGYKSQYTGTATLSLLDPLGDIAETWSLFHLWPTSVTWNDLSSESSDIVNVNATFRYDYALMGTPTKSSEDIIKENNLLKEDPKETI